MNDRVLDFLSDIYFAPIKDLLENDTCTDIYIRGSDLVLTREKGIIRRVEGRQFDSEKKLESAVNIMARKLGARLDEFSPMLDARFESGERINIVIPPVSRRPVVTIRKFIARYFSAKDLLAAGMLDQAGIDMLAFFTRLRKRIIISGAPNSGKTTMLNLICQHIGEEQGMVVSVEDTREISINSPLWESLVPTGQDPAKTREERFSEVLMNILRMDTDILIIGEIRGAEITQLLTSFNTGTGGMATIHAVSALSTLPRMESLLTHHSSMSETAIRQVLSENIDIIVHVKTLSDQGKRVTDIVEVKKPGIYQYQPLYGFCPDPIIQGRPITGKFKVLGRPDFLREATFIGRQEIPPFWRD